MNKKTLIGFSILLLLLISACTSSSNTSEQKHWTEIELENINTGDTYSISDFKGNKVLFETFAVWCVNCKKQQNEIKTLREEFGDELITISLNSDPNEEKEEVLKYVNENGFDWHYSIGTPEMSEQLLSEFGFQILNAPSAPIVMFCEDGSYSLLPEGHKTTAELREHLELSC